jgi:hypothetical protein
MSALSEIPTSLNGGEKCREVMEQDRWVKDPEQEEVWVGDVAWAEEAVWVEAEAEWAATVPELVRAVIACALLAEPRPHTKWEFLAMM